MSQWKVIVIWSPTRNSKKERQTCYQGPDKTKAMEAYHQQISEERRLPFQEVRLYFGSKRKYHYEL